MELWARLAVAASVMLLMPLLAGCLGQASDTAASAADPIGLVAASNPHAAEAGAAILRAGGNAIDAAAAVQWALNVVEPPMSGLGGGAFLMLWLQNETQLIALDGRETAPAASTPDQFLSLTGEPLPHEEASRMGVAVGVPGTLAVFHEAVHRFGTMSLAHTMQPAIQLASQGFQVNAALHNNIANQQDKLATWPAAAELFLPGSVCLPTQAGFTVVGSTLPRCVGGTPLQEGDVLVQPDLAATLRLLAEEGPAAFYRGPIAEAIVATVAQREGRMSHVDLAEYAIVEREPLVRSYRGFDVATMPPPGGGLIVLGILGILEGYDRSAHAYHSAAHLHPLIEAMHLAYADRAAYLADPDFVPVPVEGLLDPDYLADRRAQIDPGRANPDVTPGDPWRHQPRPEKTPKPSPFNIEGGHTTHFVAVDRWGNVASVTSTIESVFGSGMLVPGHGFFLNNELTDFDKVPGRANQVEPGKRPRSSMSPTIVLRDAQAYYTLGSPGGATIISTVAQGLLNVLDHPMGVQEAINATRIWSPIHPEVTWDLELGSEVTGALQRMGHEPTGPTAGRIGNIQAALRNPDGSWTGGSDVLSREGTVLYVAPEAPPSPAPGGQQDPRTPEFVHL